MKEDCQQMTKSCMVFNDLSPKLSSQPKHRSRATKTDLQPFESVGLDMFRWKRIQNLFIVHRMSGYIIIENLNRSVLCKTMTQKFKLLCLTYGFPLQVRFEKGDKFNK